MPLFCCSQQPTTDSLKRLLQTAATDSARFQLAYNLGSNYKIVNFDSALYYLNKALLIAQKNAEKINEASALTQIGFVLNKLQRLPEALQALTDALQIAQDQRSAINFWNVRKQEVKDKNYPLTILAAAHSVLGQVLQNAGRPNQAILHDKKAVELYTLIGDMSSVANITANLAYLYFVDLNKPDSALMLAKKAESIGLQKKEEKVLGYAYAEMAGIYWAMHNDSLGVAYLHRSILINKKYNPYFLAATYSSAANFYIQKKNKDSALYYARVAANTHISVSTTGLGGDFENLARSYELNNMQDSAYKYQEMALSAYKSSYQNRIKGLTGFQQLSFDQQQQLQQLEADKMAVQNRTRMYTLFAGLGLTILISFFLYRTNNQQKKANGLLQQQKNETEQQKLKAESALQRLQATQQQLIQAEKMASLGELTAGIAHEIQNPLNFVNNFSDVNQELIFEMKEEIRKGNIEEVEAIANDIEENEQKINHHGKRADAIVKGMLQHSRSNSGKKEPADINALADEYLRLSYHGLRAKDKDFNAAFETDFDESIGKVEVVPQDIGRVLLNLFNNGFYSVNEKKKAKDLEGFQNLQGLARYEPTVTISTKKLNDKVEIKVKDNGTGIPQKVVDKIFQPFFTTKPTGQGTGLGLSLSYDIIKAHCGELKVETEQGEGAEFIIQLPANTQPNKFQ